MEQNIWRRLGITSFEPNEQTPEQGQAAAAERLALGFCDNRFYGEEYCRKWKAKKDSEDRIIYDGIQREPVEVFMDENPLCSINLVKIGNCERSREHRLDD
ncbi:hypothetical protein LTR84_008907 [Exophiala bonariae]|uniref:Uncharacterized protein n=1 Tax=Exophiala bonariae TaxID=1690606 RepID=A0AAV9MVU6_9EURO|nr:hypothetical protein LTR84_008907 [Exophiala bonariae]